VIGVHRPGSLSSDRSAGSRYPAIYQIAFDHLHSSVHYLRKHAKRRIARQLHDLSFFPSSHVQRYSGILRSVEVHDWLTAVDHSAHSNSKTFKGKYEVHYGTIQAVFQISAGA